MTETMIVVICALLVAYVALGAFVWWLVFKLLLPMRAMRWVSGEPFWGVVAEDIGPTPTLGEFLLLRMNTIEVRVMGEERSLQRDDADTASGILGARKGVFPLLASKLALAVVVLLLAVYGSQFAYRFVMTPIFRADNCTFVGATQPPLEIGVQYKYSCDSGNRYTRFTRIYVEGK